MRKSTIQHITLVAISVCLTLTGLELAVRIHRGSGRMVYHSRLGWVPRPGRAGCDWISNVDASGIRSNGVSMVPIANRPILAVGDSFTFGDEVEDSETWPAHLEKILNKRILNAGAGAYGIDQAFLRAELLLEKYDPDVVIMSFISDDINRTEYSYYPWGQGWKPYFEYGDGSLILRNVPVPREPVPRVFRRFQTLRRALGHSALANAVLDRLSPPAIERVHRNGENVSVDLLVRLGRLTRGRGVKLIAITLATNGHIGDNARLPNVVKRVRDKGVEVFDLATGMLKLQPRYFQNLFLPGGHYSSAMNRWVAMHIAAFLHERGILPPSGKSRIFP